MSKPSGTNCPKLSRAGVFFLCVFVKIMFHQCVKNIKVVADYKDLGGYSDGVPPLPIPNREVKPVSADGTAY